MMFARGFQLPLESSEDKGDEVMQMNLRRIGLTRSLLLASILLLPSWEVMAEKDEISVGLQTGLMLPGFSPTSSTAFTLATWNAGICGTYAVLDDLTLTASFIFSVFDGSANGYRKVVDDLEYKGKLRFASQLYQPEVGARYKVYGGYDLAPYVEASLGYAWSVYDSPKMTTAQDQELGIEVKDFADGAFMLTVGIYADYRLFNMLLVGLGFRYSQALGTPLLQGYFSFPLQVSYYW